MKHTLKISFEFFKDITIEQLAEIRSWPLDHHHFDTDEKIALLKKEIGDYSFVIENTPIAIRHGQWVYIEWNDFIPDKRICDVLNYLEVGDFWLYARLSGTRFKKNEVISYVTLLEVDDDNNDRSFMEQ